MATNARDSDRPTSHDAIDPASLEIATHREKVRLIHMMHMDTGLIDDTLGLYYGPTKDREHRKRRADITVGSKAQCEKSLVALADCPFWGREATRIGTSGREQTVWGFCKCPDKACMSRPPRLSLRAEIYRLREIVAKLEKENAELKKAQEPAPEKGFFGGISRRR